MTTGTIEFVCGECGLLTPGAFRMPTHYDGPVLLSHDCHHCDAPIERRFETVADLRVAAGMKEGAQQA